MATCDNCGCEVEMPFACSHCGGCFCPAHRLPENHLCVPTETQNSDDEDSENDDIDDWSPSSKYSWRSEGSEVRSADENTVAEQAATIVSYSLVIGVVLTLAGGVLVLVGGMVGTGIAPIDDRGGEIVDVASESIQTDESGSEGTVESTAEQSTTQTATPQDDEEPTYGAEVEREIEEAIHNEIKRVRDSSLNHESDLQEVSRYHSERMATEDFFDHIAPDGEDVEDRFGRFGYHCQGSGDLAGGENIAQSWIDDHVIGHGFLSTPEDVATAVVDGWIDSPGHRDNIMHDGWNGHGVGVYVSDGGEVFVTQTFC